jgi:alpha-methylacyl-CoA racemase
MVGKHMGEHGAHVIHVESRTRPDGFRMHYPPYKDNKPGLDRTGTFAIFNDSKYSVSLNLKSKKAVELAKKLINWADVVIENFVPGVMERLGLGPDVCQARNAALVYGRITGWGQSGPLAKVAGHDINYIALTGMLHAMGRADTPPAPPLNLVGDFGGGAMMLAFGVVCAVLEARKSGQGQVVDAAMTDGAALLGAMMYGLRAFGSWSDRRGANMLDGGAHFYDTYACLDGKFISIGAIEPQFYALLLKLAEIDDPDFDAQMDPAAWPRLTDVFKTRTRDGWCQLLEGTDVCFAPVLDMGEAPQHPHNAARGTFVDVGGVTQPAPAPRFSRTAPEIGSAPAQPGQHSAAVLGDWGWSADEVEALTAQGVI